MQNQPWVPHLLGQGRPLHRVLEPPAVGGRGHCRRRAVFSFLNTGQPCQLPGVFGVALNAWALGLGGHAFCVILSAAKEPGSGILRFSNFRSE